MSYDVAVCVGHPRLDADVIGECAVAATRDLTAEPRGQVHTGLGAFELNGATVYHTYAGYVRGLEPFNTRYQVLDRLPRPRDEEPLPFKSVWLRRHDQYEVDQ